MIPQAFINAALSKIKELFFNKTLPNEGKQAQRKILIYEKEESIEKSGGLCQYLAVQWANEAKTADTDHFKEFERN